VAAAICQRHNEKTTMTSAPSDQTSICTCSSFVLGFACASSGFTNSRMPVQTYFAVSPRFHLLGNHLNALLHSKHVELGQDAKV